MASVFVNAATARKDSRNNSIIHSEVRSLESSVYASIDLGDLSTVVDTGTTMTGSTDYYNAYYSITNNETILDQINYVRKYFVDLGYNVQITENPVTENTIVWTISW
jgi:hypothetical protein